MLRDLLGLKTICLIVRGSIFLLALAPAAAEVPAGEPGLVLVGEPELYMSQQDLNCRRPGTASPSDQPDMPATAFRRKDGSVIVLVGNQNNYVLEGASVDSARRTSCSQLVASANDADPQDFNARRWLFALHAKSYDLTLGFAHNEYHGDDFFGDRCKVSSRLNFECWYASTTVVFSDDGGFSFKTPPVPDNVLASPPVKFSIGESRVGAASPKVVGNPHDQMVYVMINYLDVNRKLPIGQCLLRGSGTAFNDWRAWDGNGFSLDMESPYVIARDKDCVPVIPYQITSLKYIPALDKFVALGSRQDKVVYAFSSDLVNWTRPNELMQFNRIQTWAAGEPPAKAYFSLLDSESSSINFDTMESRPYLYYVQFGTDAETFLRTRDVYRQRVEFK